MTDPSEDMQQTSPQAPLPSPPDSGGGSNKTLIFVGVGVGCGLLLLLGCVGLLLPVLAAARRTARLMQNNANVRDIHQMMVAYAQGNGGNLPGLDAHGNVVPDGDDTLNSGDGRNPAARYAILFDMGYSNPLGVISPAEIKSPWQGGALTSDNFSYAMLELGTDVDAEGKPVNGGARVKEWRDSFNGAAIVMSDRNLGTQSQPLAIWTNEPGDWRGSVLFNDNAVRTENTAMLMTQYDIAPANDGFSSSLDHLFRDDTARDNPTDAAMVFQDATSLENQ